MSLPPPRLFDPLKDKPLLSQIAQIHADCITNDHQLATFLPPLDIPKMIVYWLAIAERISKEEVAIILQFAEGEEETEVAGYVCLTMPASETGPFRAYVEKLMVSTRHRRKGVARRVLGMLEELAKEKHRHLLLLDTKIGSAADDMYPRLGYKSYGIVPRYGIDPEDGRLVDERMYYKDLRDEE